MPRNRRVHNIDVPIATSVTQPKRHMGHIKSIAANRGVGQVSKPARIGKAVMQVTLVFRCRELRLPSKSVRHVGLHFRQWLLDPGHEHFNKSWPVEVVLNVHLLRPFGARPDFPTAD